MTKIKKIIIILLVLIIIALILGYIYLGVYKPEKVLSLHQNGLYQNYADQEFDEDSDSDKFYKEKTMHFIAKHRISKGKYGFVKKIEIKKKSLIGINERIRRLRELDRTPSDLVFGVYRDSKCSDVIEKLQGDSLVRGLNVKLEKGIYYIGIYTTDITATYKIPVLVDCCYLYPKVILREHKKIYFSMGDKSQVNTFTIVAKKTGRIIIDGTYSDYADTTMKDENGKNVKDYREKDVRESEFDIKKGKKYKLIVKSGKYGVITEIVNLKYSYIDKE